MCAGSALVLQRPLSCLFVTTSNSQLPVISCGYQFICYYQGFPVTYLLKNPPAIWETWEQSLGWEDPQEKEMNTHSSILAWKIPWTI